MKRILASERLYLREFIQEDLAILYHLDSDPEVLRYIGAPKTMEESRARLQWAFQDYERGEGLGKWMAVEKESGKEIGWYVLNYLDKTELVEIGYRLKTEFWNKGYATEMAKEILKYGFDILSLDKIVGVTHQDNQASKRVLNKIGLEYLGIRFYYELDLSYFEKTNTKKQ
jgi:RimJ/RimL family protein N-acetyltransferase